MDRFGELDSLKARLDVLRPLDTDKVRAVQEKLHIEWTYNSNALEGNPLTLGETSFFIREGLTSKGRPLQAFLEAKNHIAAIEYLEELVKAKSPITERLIREFHAMLFDRVERVEIGTGAERRVVVIEGGCYKKENNHVVQLNGNIKWFTDALQVTGEMERLIVWWNKAREQAHPLELAAQLHHRFVSIHPFVDGNGRIARLLMNVVLMQAGYTPAIIPVEERQRYLEGLQAADAGDYNPIASMIEELAAKTLKTTIDVVEGRDAFDFDDLSRMLTTLDREAATIGSELGSAVVPPEARSLATAHEILGGIQAQLNEHSKKNKTSSLVVSISVANGLPQQVFQNPHYQQLQGKIERAKPGLPTVVLSIRGSARYVPNLAVYIAALAGRYEVNLICITHVERFNSQNQPQPDQAPHFKSLPGSIYYEDWNKAELTTFVLDILKHAYHEFETEMVRRKQLIAEEERKALETRPRKME
jgi:Fic family protein